MSYVVDGVRQESSFGGLFEEPWRPWGSRPAPDAPGAFPIPSPQSEIAQEAARLHANLVKRAEHVQIVRQKTQDALEAVTLAHEAYQAEIQRSAQAGVVSEIDQQLRNAREAAVAAANPEIHTERERAAQDLATDACSEYRSFLVEHSLVLVDELRPAGVQVAAKYAKAYADARAILEPLERDHERIRLAVSGLVGAVEPFREQDISADPSLPPLPSADALERYQAFNAPAPSDTDA